MKDYQQICNPTEKDSTKSSRYDQYTRKANFVTYYILDATLLIKMQINKGILRLIRVLVYDVHSEGSLLITTSN